jgi:DNA repair protein RadC
LAKAGIKSLNDLKAFTEKEISKLHGIGPDVMAKIHTAFKEKALSFSTGH